MKKIFYLLLIALFCGAFVSCSKDDNAEDETSYEELIIGTWNLVKDEFFGEYIYYDYGDFIFRFKDNGTGYTIYDGYRSDIEWEIIDSKLYIYDESDDSEMEATIKELTEDALVIRIYEEYEGNKISITEYFEREY